MTGCGSDSVVLLSESSVFGYMYLTWLALVRTSPGAHACKEVGTRLLMQQEEMLIKSEELPRGFR